MVYILSRPECVNIENLLYRLLMQQETCVGAIFYISGDMADLNRKYGLIRYL